MPLVYSMCGRLLLFALVQVWEEEGRGDVVVLFWFGLLCISSMVWESLAGDVFRRHGNESIGSRCAGEANVTAEFIHSLA